MVIYCLRLGGGGISKEIVSDKINKKVCNFIHGKRGMICLFRVMKFFICFFGDHNFQFLFVNLLCGIS